MTHNQEQSFCTVLGIWYCHDEGNCQSGSRKTGDVVTCTQAAQRTPSPLADSILVAVGEVDKGMALNSLQPHAQVENRPGEEGSSQPPSMIGRMGKTSTGTLPRPPPPAPAGTLWWRWCPSCWPRICPALILSGGGISFDDTWGKCEKRNKKRGEICKKKQKNKIIGDHVIFVK